MGILKSSELKGRQNQAQKKIRSYEKWLRRAYRIAVWETILIAWVRCEELSHDSGRGDEEEASNVKDI